MAAFVILCRTELLFADTELTLEQKNQKAQEFNEDVQEQLYESRAAIAPPPEKPWTLSISTNYGHDSNTSYDSRRKRDVFHQETITGLVQNIYPAMDGLIGAGKLGIQASLDDLNYSKQNGSDSRNSKINPFVSFDITPTLSIKAEYDFKNYWYIHNNSLSYHGHELKATVSETGLYKQIHKVYVSTEQDDYSRRKQLSAFNTSLDDARVDHRQEIGYDLTWLPLDTLIMGVTAAYQVNDSNDLFHDLNDYEGCKVSGYIYKVLNDRISWVGAAGYDYKNYGHKLLPSKLGAERDEFVYVVNYLFITLSPRTQLALSYFFDQNYSNDPVLDFTGHTVTAGVTVKI